MISLNKQLDGFRVREISRRRDIVGRSDFPIPVGHGLLERKAGWFVMHSIKTATDPIGCYAFPLQFSSMDTETFWHPPPFPGLAHAFPGFPITGVRSPVCLAKGPFSERGSWEIQELRQDQRVKGRTNRLFPVGHPLLWIGPIQPRRFPNY